MQHYGFSANAYVCNKSNLSLVWVSQPWLTTLYTNRMLYTQFTYFIRIHAEPRWAGSLGLNSQRSLSSGSSWATLESLIVSSATRKVILGGDWKRRTLLKWMTNPQPALSGSYTTSAAPSVTRNTHWFLTTEQVKQFPGASAFAWRELGRPAHPHVMLPNRLCWR